MLPQWIIETLVPGSRTQPIIHNESRSRRACYSCWTESGLELQPAARNSVILEPAVSSSMVSSFCALDYLHKPGTNHWEH